MRGILTKSGTVLAGLLALYAASTPRLGYAESPQTLASLSLEELMDIEVTSASKVPSALSSAPTSITVVTREEIKRFGYRTVAEALKNVIGVNVFSNQYAFSFFRGVAIAGDFNTRVLVLIDGHKTNDANFNQGFLGEEFMGNVEDIERIEITKGPASSVWGTNAMLALVNVVTRKGSEVGGAEIVGAYGSSDRSKGFAAIGNKLKNGVEYKVSASYTNSEGPDNINFHPVDGVTQLVAKHIDQQYLHRAALRLDYQDFHFSSSMGDRMKQIPYGFNGTVFGDGGNTYEDAFGNLDLSYDKVLNAENHSRVFARVYYDKFIFNGNYIPAIPIPDPPRIINSDKASALSFGAEARYSRDILSNLSALVGTEVTDFYKVRIRNFNTPPISPDDVASVAEEPFTLSSYYTEFHYRPIEALEIVGGGRADVYSTQDDAVTPRASIIYQPIAGTTTRLMYGEGFRVSDNFERNYFGQDSKKDLRPEKVKTFEFAVQQKLAESVQANLSLYHIRFQHLIAETKLAEQNLEFFNGENDITSQGAELSVNARFKDGLIAYGGFSLFRAEQNNQRLPASARYLGYAGVSVPLYENKLFLSPQARYVSSLESGGIYTRIGGYWVADTTLLLTNLPCGWEMSASIYNMFDQKYGFPANTVTQFNEFPELGINYRLQASYAFK